MSDYKMSFNWNGQIVINKLRRNSAVYRTVPSKTNPAARFKVGNVDGFFFSPPSNLSITNEGVQRYIDDCGKALQVASFGEFVHGPKAKMEAVVNQNLHFNDAIKWFLSGDATISPNKDNTKCFLNFSLKIASTEATVYTYDVDSILDNEYKLVYLDDPNALLEENSDRLTPMSKEALNKAVSNQVNRTPIRLEAPIDKKVQRQIIPYNDGRYDAYTLLSGYVVLSKKEVELSDHFPTTFDQSKVKEGAIFKDQKTAQTMVGIDNNVLEQAPKIFFYGDLVEINTNEFYKDLVILTLNPDNNYKYIIMHKKDFGHLYFDINEIEISTNADAIASIRKNIALKNLSGGSDEV